MSQRTRTDGRVGPAPVPTMKDVAARAGVAVSTVSRVLTGAGYTSEETRGRVLAASEALGYSPSLRARGLRQSRTMTIGVAVADLGNPVFLAYLQGVENTAGEAGYAAVVCDAQGAADKQQSQFERLFAHRVDGLLVIPPLLSPAALEPFLKAGVPVAPTADIDDRTAARLHLDAAMPAMRAAMDLLHAGGHERIAYVARKQRMREVAALRGLPDFRVAGLRRAGYEFEERFILRVETVADCRAAVAQLEAAGDAPTAYVISPYGLAPRMLAAIYERGLRIPEDVSFICFGESDWAAAHRPPLAVISRDYYAQAAAWTRDLMDRIDGRPAGPVPNLEYEFDPRGSVGPAARPAASRPSSRASSVGSGAGT